MSLDALMDQLVTLYRMSPVQGGTGAQRPASFSQDNNCQLVPCSIQPASASTRLDYMQRDMRVSHSLYFDYDWAPRSRDKFVSEDGTREYIVQGWYESLEIKDTWTADCELVRLPKPLT